jgi:hypothetical protein
VDISAALAADLAALTQALDNPNIDLEQGLQAFIGDAKLAISSYTGMTMTIALDGHTVSFTAHHDATSATVAATSLLIPLAALTTSDTASTLRLYAATPGAFVDLAADLSYALGTDPTTLVLDNHLPAPEDSSGMTGLAAHFAIDQAIGVLIGGGHTPETARDELHRLAAIDHGDLRAAAEQIISTAGRDPTHTT